MFLVFLMLFDPAGGWTRAAESSRNTVRVLLLHLLPLLLLGGIAEGYGMIHWGKRVGEFGRIKHFTMAEVLPYQACHFGVGLLVVCLSAVVLQHLGNTFQIGRASCRERVCLAV